MVTIARESRRLNQTKLASALGVSQGALSRIENGLRGVSDSLLEKLSKLLDYPADFFLQNEEVYGFGTSELFHRKRRDVSNETLAAVHAQINIRRIHLSRMLKGVEIGPISILPKEVEASEGATRIAQAVRASWRLPPGPVQNVVQTIERARGIIIPLDFGTARIDAVSQWPPSMPPLFFVNTHSVGDRLRFTLCHELAHMILHQRDPNPDMERQADEFAAEFLMPKKEIRPYLTDLSLPKLASLKSYWKVSMAALLKRAADLGVITPRHSRTLWMQMGRSGYRMHEPSELDLPFEEPQLYQEIIGVYRNKMKFSASEFARMFNMFENEVRSLYLGGPRHLRVVG
jgi:Zn-dependent peptidase ImmA (M78 family)/plasmid maintenance system antidote protein VapI